MGGKHLRSGKEYVNRDPRNRNVPFPRSRPRGRPPRSNRRHSEAPSVNFFPESESLTNFPIRSVPQSAQRPNPLNQTNTPRLGNIEQIGSSFEAFSTANMNGDLSSHSVGTSQSPAFNRSNNQIAASADSRSASLSRSSLDDLLEYNNVSTSAQNVSDSQDSSVHNSNNPFSPAVQYLELPETPIVSTRMISSASIRSTPDSHSSPNGSLQAGVPASNVATVT